MEFRKFRKLIERVFNIYLSEEEIERIYNLKIIEESVKELWDLGEKKRKRIMRSRLIQTLHRGD
jgi:hypothetical protein